MKTHTNCEIKRRRWQRLQPSKKQQYKYHDRMHYSHRTALNSICPVILQPPVGTGEARLLSLPDGLRLRAPRRIMPRYQNQMQMLPKIRQEIFPSQFESNLSINRRMSPLDIAASLLIPSEIARNKSCHPGQTTQPFSKRTRHSFAAESGGSVLLCSLNRASLAT